MRKIVVTMLLTVMSSSAGAEWVRAGDTGNAAIYFDPATLSRAGNIVNMDVLYDLKAAVHSMTNGNQYASQKSQTEYDCKDKQWRMLNFSWYSGNMGAGKMVEYLADAFKWEPVPPGSGVEALWQLACGKR
jgi:hypothetical protein